MGGLGILKLQNWFITVTSYLRQQQLEFKAILPSSEAKCIHEIRSMSTTPIYNNSFSYINKSYLFDLSNCITEPAGADRNYLVYCPSAWLPNQGGGG